MQIVYCLFFSLVCLVSCSGSNDAGTTQPNNASDAPIVSSPDFTITIGDKDGRQIKPLNGVNAGPNPTGDEGNADLVEEYRELGIQYVRTHDYYGPFDMAEMYPDRTKNPDEFSSFNLADSDTHYEGIAAAGCELYFRIGDSFNNASPPETGELDNWIKAALNIISHYKEGKWSGHNSRIDYIEIWNEPDNSQFWPDKSLMAFFVLFDRTAKALREKFPDVKIGGPGFTQNVNLDESKKSILKDFLDYLAEHDTPFDFLSIHQYTNEPGKITTALDNASDLLKEKGFDAKAVHVTEWNTDIEGDTSPADSADLRINARGAAVNTATWIEMQNNGVDMAFFFRGNDTSMNLSTFYGLYKADGTPKKTALAFSFFSRLSQYSQRLSAVHSSASEQLYLIAGEDGSGKKALILSNTSQETYHYSTNLDQHIAGILEVSDRYNAIQTIHPEKGVIDIAAYGVHFIEFQ